MRTGRNKRRANGDSGRAVRSGCRAPSRALVLVAPLAAPAAQRRARGSGRSTARSCARSLSARDPYARGRHRGVDLAAARGSPVRSACAGRVTLRRPRAARRADRQRPLRRDRRDLPAARLRSPFAARPRSRAARRSASVGSSSDPRSAAARTCTSARATRRRAATSTRSGCLARAAPGRRCRPRSRAAPRAAARPGTGFAAPARGARPALPRPPPRRAGAGSGAPRALSSSRPRRAAHPAAEPLPLVPRRRRCPEAAPGRRDLLIAARRANRGVPWSVWVGLACVGFGLPVGGVRATGGAAHATSRVARTA